METLATRTRGEHIFIAVKNASICSGLDLKYLRGICTEGAPAMTGNQQGFVSRITRPTNMTTKNSSIFTALSTTKHHVPNPLL